MKQLRRDGVIVDIYPVFQVRGSRVSAWKYQRGQGVRAEPACTIGVLAYPAGGSRAAMGQPSTKQVHHYTWTDYQTWDDDQRWEILGGDAYLMSSPTARHQRVVGELYRQMANLLRGHRCQLFVSPMDVVLSEEDVVQPDLLVVCDPQQIQRTHIAGAPTLVVEILSASSASRERLLKLDLYARIGVKEYWIVTPWPSLVEVLALEGNRYVVNKVFGKDQTLVSATFPELTIDLTDVFDFPLEPGEEPPVVREPPAPAYRAR